MKNDTFYRMAAGANDRLRKARKAKGISQGALGKLVGVSQATINRYETGVIAISPLAIRPISEALGCSGEWLSSGEGEQFSNERVEVRAVSNSSVDDLGAAQVIERLRRIVSTSVGFTVTGDQALEWVIRKAGVADEVFSHRA